MSYRQLVAYALRAGLTFTEARRMAPGMIFDLFIMRRRYDDEQHQLKRE